MVPIAIKKFPKAVRWFGKQLENAGARVQGSVDEVGRYERERQERQEAAAPKSTVTSTSAKRPHSATNGVKESKMNEKVDVQAPTPETKTASPHGHVEMEAQKTKPKKAAPKPAAKGSVRAKPKVQGAAPPANDPKRSRKKSEGQV
jgi:hypothetical protein